MIRTTVHIDGFALEGSEPVCRARLELPDGGEIAFAFPPRMSRSPGELSIGLRELADQARAVGLGMLAGCAARALKSERALMDSARGRGKERRGEWALWQAEVSAVKRASPHWADTAVREAAAETLGVSLRSLERRTTVPKIVPTTG